MAGAGRSLYFWAFTGIFVLSMDFLALGTATPSCSGAGPGGSIYFWGFVRSPGRPLAWPLEPAEGGGAGGDRLLGLGPRRGWGLGMIFLQAPPGPSQKIHAKAPGRWRRKTSFQRPRPSPPPVQIATSPGLRNNPLRRIIGGLEVLDKTPPPGRPAPGQNRKSRDRSPRRFPPVDQSTAKVGCLQVGGLHPDPQVVSRLAMNRGKPPWSPILNKRGAKARWNLNSPTFFPRVFLPGDDRDAVFVKNLVLRIS